MGAAPWVQHRSTPATCAAEELWLIKEGLGWSYGHESCAGPAPPAFPLPPAASLITEFMVSQMSLLTDANQNCWFSSRNAL